MKRFKDAVFLIEGERKNQVAKWGIQKHDMMTWLAILHEETGELAEACLHEKFGGSEADNVMMEAIQVAAVATQIVEFLLEQQEQKQSVFTPEQLEVIRKADERMQAEFKKNRELGYTNETEGAP